MYAEDKGAECHRAKSEDGVANHAQPTERLHDVGLQKFGAPRVPIAVLDGCPGLHQADRQQAQGDHRDESANDRTTMAANASHSVRKLKDAPPMVSEAPAYSRVRTGTSK